MIITSLYVCCILYHPCFVYSACFSLCVMRSVIVTIDRLNGYEWTKWMNDTDYLKHAPVLHSLLMSSLNSSTGFHLTGIQFKLATLTFKALHTGRPPYITDLLQHHQSTRSLRSSSSYQLFIPRHNLSFGSRAFRFSAPRIWNKLPLRIRETQSLPAFKRHLKTHFSPVSLPHPLATHHIKRALIL